jgi:hypothetical protein
LQTLILFFLTDCAYNKLKTLAIHQSQFLVELHLFTLLQLAVAVVAVILVQAQVQEV